MNRLRAMMIPRLAVVLCACTGAASRLPEQSPPAGARFRDPHGVLIVLRDAAPPFLRTVCDALRASGFAPSVVDGRPRRALVVAPFEFAVAFSIAEMPRQTVDVARYRSLLAGQPADSVVARLERAPHCP